MEKIKCPGCGEVVCPQPVGSVDADGEWQYELTECPIPSCGHTFTSEELKHGV